MARRAARALPQGAAAPERMARDAGYGKSDDLALVVQLLAFWPSTFLADGDACLL